MSTTANFNLPLLTATQAGKEITVNQALVLIDSALKAAGSGQTAATLTADELSTVLMGPTQLASLIDTELAKLPVPLTDAQLATQLAALPAALTLAQLQTELANLPTSSGGLTLAQLQAELANLPTGSGSGISLSQLQSELNALPVPATVSDVQNAVAGISVSGTGGVTIAGTVAMFQGATPSGWKRLGAIKDPASFKVQVGKRLPDSSSYTGAFPAIAYSASTGRFYMMDGYRGFIEYDPLTGDTTTLQAPPNGYGSVTSNYPSLRAWDDTTLIYAGTANSKAVYFFDTVAKTWSVGPTLAYSQYEGLILKDGPANALYVGGHTSLITSITPTTSASVTFTTPTGRSLNTPRGCVLPSGAKLALLASSTPNYYYAAFTLAYDANQSKYVFTERPGMPDGLTVYACHATSYGAVMVVKEGPLVRILRYVEATNTWSFMHEYLGTIAAPAIATDGYDQSVLITENGNAGPGLFIADTAIIEQPDVFYAVKL